MLNKFLKIKFKIYSLFLIILMQAFDVYADNKELAMSALVMLTSSDYKYSSGFIAGEDSDWIYIVTAANSLIGELNSRGKIFAEFKQLPGEIFKTEIEHVDIESDIAVAKVNKKHASTIKVPKLSYSFAPETHDKLQLIGRKSLQELWRVSPLFELLNDSKLSETDKPYLVLKTFFELPGFYGGGAFDKDWRLIGMPIRAKFSEERYAIDELAHIIPISWIGKKLESLSIPLADYLKFKQGDALTGKLAYSQTLSLRANLFSDDLGGHLSLLFYVFMGKTVNAATVSVYVMNDKNQWFLINKKDLGSEIFNSEASFLIPMSSKKIVICHSNELELGGYSVISHQINNIDFYTNEYSPTKNTIEINEGLPQYITIKNPCDFAVRKMGIDVAKYEGINQEIINQQSIEKKLIPKIIKKLYLGAKTQGLKRTTEKIRIEDNNAKVEVKLSLGTKAMIENNYEAFITINNQSTIHKMFSVDYKKYFWRNGFLSGLTVGDVKKITICHVWKKRNKWISVKNNYIPFSPEDLNERVYKFPMLVHKVFTPDPSSFLIRSSNNIDKACDLSGKKIIAFNHDKKRTRTKIGSDPKREKGSVTKEEILKKVCVSDSPQCQNLRKALRQLEDIQKNYQP